MAQEQVHLLHRFLRHRNDVGVDAINEYGPYYGGYRERM